MKAWEFLNERGDFRLEAPHRTSCLYFPLANEAGLMSSITPCLHGDIKTGHNTYLTAPVTAEDLHNSRASRNFWLYLQDGGPWSAAGVSAPQLARVFTPEDEEVSLTAGFLWQKLTRTNNSLGVAVEITSFVPAVDEQVELMRVSVTNLRRRPLVFTPTAAIPLFCRSADNLRDHRHVTSLLHRIRTAPYGVEVQPAFCFDERGHKPNRLVYAVLGCGAGGAKPAGTFPILARFIGEGGSLEWPQAVVGNAAPVAPGAVFAGEEAIGALRFAEVELAPGETASFFIAIAVAEDGRGLATMSERYCREQAYTMLLKKTQAYWQQKLSLLEFHSSDSGFDTWLKWVGLQPMLRRIYGCSFLPHHDYGRGGRGWRDLWQDCLALLLHDPGEVRSLLLNNYAGVRIDGSNATIIGARPGEFIADRNNLRRIWMDHGAWPFLATRLYLDQSGDLAFLLEEQTYFRDGQTFRAKALDPDWRQADGNELRQMNGEVYRGTILEHILAELATAFFNVGDHNHLRLEGADWNDALDMAADKGESVAFTALYAYDLLELASVLLDLGGRLALGQIEVAAELLPLFDTLGEALDYGDAAAKRELLQRYLASVQGRLSGAKVWLDTAALAGDLARKAAWIGGHLRADEWLVDVRGYGWFNGYYDNLGRRVEGEHEAGIRITLTGQVFPILSGIANNDQVAAIIKTARRYLRHPELGSYCLNSDFGGPQPDLGRAFAFAYGHKENGAIFCHMVVMYGYALYRRGFVEEGHEVLASLHRVSADFAKSRIYPGMPEYINADGRGMYHYLTGSASWYLLTMLTEVFGIKGHRGDLAIEPKLVRDDFDAEGAARVRTVFAERELEISYLNPQRLTYGEYAIRSLCIGGEEISCRRNERAAIIDRLALERLAPGRHDLKVVLG